MSENRYKKFYVDWWKIRKSTIYLIIAIVVIGGSITFGLNYASKNNWFVPDDTLNVPQDAARIISFEGDVRITRAATRETILVTKETYVAAGDTIQTQADGRAIVLMIDGSKYSVRPNSTVVVKASTSFIGGKDVRVTLDDGQLNVRTEEQQNAQNIVEVADTENRLLPNTDASFNTNPASNGGEIRVSRGGVETTIGGAQTTVNADEFASVHGGKLTNREKLLSPPQQVSPDNSTQIVDPGSGVSVTFVWRGADGNLAANYYLQVSRSPTFSADAFLIDRGSLQSHEFRLNQLSPGTYYWRVKSTSRTGQTTNWNEPWKFIVVQGSTGVAIDASDFKVESIGGRLYLVSGKTKPGMSVRCQGRETFSGPDGSFRMQISSPSISAAVEISDDRGSRSGYVISLRNGAVLRRY
jgi:hypothetical protein